jgi:hypothetical protein
MLVETMRVFVESSLIRGQVKAVRVLVEADSDNRSR